MKRLQPLELVRVLTTRFGPAETTQGGTNRCGVSAILEGRQNLGFYPGLSFSFSRCGREDMVKGDAKYRREVELPYTRAAVRAH